MAEHTVKHDDGYTVLSYLLIDGSFLNVMVSSRDVHISTNDKTHKMEVMTNWNSQEPEGDYVIDGNGDYRIVE